MNKKFLRDAANTIYSFRLLLFAVLLLSACGGIGLRPDFNGLGNSDISHLVKQHWHGSGKPISTAVANLISGNYSNEITFSQFLTSKGFNCPARESPEISGACDYRGFVAFEKIEFIGTTSFLSKSLGWGRKDIYIFVRWQETTEPTILVNTD